MWIIKARLITDNILGEGVGTIGNEVDWLMILYDALFIIIYIWCL